MKIGQNYEFAHKIMLYSFILLWICYFASNEKKNVIVQEVLDLDFIAWFKH